MTAAADDPLQAQACPLGDDAAWCAALLAVDPIGLGGACLRAGPGPWRDAWLDRVKSLLPQGTPIRRLPHGASDSALLGGLDLAATLSRGQPVLQPGLLSQADGGLILLAMAERTSAETAAKLAAVLDTRQLQLQRDGLAQSLDLHVGVIALDEGASDDELMPPALQDRLAFWIEAPQAQDEQQALLQAADLQSDAPLDAMQVLAARQRLTHLPAIDARQLQALCATAVALGIDSLRPPLLAAKAARAAAALSGAAQVDDHHASLAVRLVLAPRATCLPAPPPSEECDRATPETPDASPQEPAQDALPPEPADHADEPPADEQPERPSDQELQEMMIAAARASLSPGLLAALRAGKLARQSAGAGGKAGSSEKNFRRGRPLGAVRGELRGGARLSVLATLRAAAPWQVIRQRTSKHMTHSATGRPMEATGNRRIEVRREDFHIMRFKQQRSTATVFVVDASGSAALHRLAEAKGAVELLLADCYVRRDRVAVIAFRGAGAQVLLPPTRSLARAKRALAGLPGGGGTPLAAALDAAHGLAQQIERSGDTPVIVLLTDGRANIARDGSPGRTQAGQDALAAAQPFAASGLSCLLIDTSPQPQPTAQALAQAMRAHYVPLPHADAQDLSKAVRLARPLPA